MTAEGRGASSSSDDGDASGRAARSLDGTPGLLDIGSNADSLVPPRPPPSATLARLDVWSDGARIDVTRPAMRQRRQRPSAGGGRRGTIGRLSPGVRRRLRLELSTLDVLIVPLVVGLTYPGDAAPSVASFKLHRSRLMRRLRRRWPKSAGFFAFRLGFHRSGVPHIHGLVYGISHEALWPWLAVVWPDVSDTADLPHVERRTYVEPAEDVRRCVSYLTAPDRRDVEEANGPWGRRVWTYGDATPFRSEVVTAEMPPEVADRLVRYFCRKARIPPRGYQRLSLSLDPAQWSRVVAYELEAYHARTYEALEDDSDDPDVGTVGGLA